MTAATDQLIRTAVAARAATDPVLRARLASRILQELALGSAADRLPHPAQFRAGTPAGNVIGAVPGVLFGEGTR